MPSDLLFDYLDTFLRQLRDGDCVKVIVAKPYGPGFRALVKAQRHNGVLPTKLTEMIVHPQAVRSTQNSYPFKPLASLASQDDSTYTPSQDTSSHHASTQSTSAHNTPNQVGSAQAGTSQTSMTPPGSAVKMPRNSSGQRVDPRVDAIAWFINAGRKQKSCYEHHLQGYCTWSPTPCPNTHSKDSLSIQQLNALQVLARELLCHMGNECQDWACCFGHRCPYSGRCTKGRNCRFSREMHITDLKVVR